ncbi:unnamed protein product [Clonostachys rosea f. rosea IK726]|uniref:Protein HRI1 n=2 Tax=Bionectria ochroleuca TaxID=29856 RepID=A0A0B7K816_BIOOC|nr:unnamed protein product [Clonostachys rosea f. rosea IK726]
MSSSQAVQRISIRWLPEPAYEDTDTVALNVGGYFIDLRVVKETGSIQWSRAGERILLKENPLTFRWTHIIDSLDLTVPDEAHFERLPNGDDLEIGSTPCPHKGGALTEYEEVWRDTTSRKEPGDLSWILQSADGTTFIGRVGTIYLAIRKSETGDFSARREDLSSSSQTWEVTFESGKVESLPRASSALKQIGATKRVEHGTLHVDDINYIVRAFSNS